MPRRPTSSAASSRPYTSSGDRPTTAVSGSAYYDRGFQYTGSQDFTLEEEDEEEEEESEEEDVFAYLPPVTGQQPAEGEPDQPAHDIAIPKPAFNPSSPYPLDSPGFSPGPSHPLYDGYPPSAFPQTAVETPPSTASQQDDDPYRMRRMSTTVPNTPTTSGRSHGLSVSRRSGNSIREVHVALPDPSRSLKTGTDTKRRSFDGKRRRGSLDTATNTASMSMVDAESRDGSIKMEFDFDNIEDEEDSPYPEVRASVSNVDDPDMPVMTFRMWFIGLLLCMVSGGMNVYFNFRQPAPSIVPLALLLLAYPVGKFAAFSLPISTYRLPRLLGGAEFSLNPGPWNIKEHALVYIMANVAIGPPYALNAVVVSEVYYHIPLGFSFTLVFVLATQLTGFGVAGMCRGFLVWPASMVWPGNLVVCTLLNTLHAEEDEESGGTTRFRFFLLTLIGSFFWMFLPGYLFTGLSVFSWVCWIVPENVPVNQLFGVEWGLGMGVITFDWSQVSWIGSPLMVPWWAQVHIFTGFVLFYWILTPALYYSNVWQLSHFPMGGDVPYDKFGAQYNVTRVLQGGTTFNSTAYADYSDLYLPAMYAVTYLLAFTLTTCVIVHTALYHGRSILNGIKRVKIEKDDIHAKLMRNYPEVPTWWYAGVFVVFFCLAIVAVEVWNTGVPVWALLLSVSLPIIYVLPSGFIYAMTGQGITVNLLAQVIPGTLLSGKPLANMIFKAYAVQTLGEAQQFVMDLKLGHYVKVPPRATFIVQAVGTILAAFMQTGVKTWLFANVIDICTQNQPSQLTCPHNEVYYTASAVWGLIGPSRQFGHGSIYHIQLFALVVGAVLPIPVYLLHRRYPNSWSKFISTPVLINGVQNIPPATGINYSSWFIVGFIFQYLIRRRNFPWWSKFNYVTSAALDSGTVLAVIVIFLALEFPKPNLQPKWWGNEVFKHTADWNQTPFRSIPPGGVPV